MRQSGWRFIIIINRVSGVVTNGGDNDSGDVEDDVHDLVEVKEHEYGCAKVCQEPEGGGWVRCLLLEQTCINLRYEEKDQPVLEYHSSESAPTKQIRRLVVNSEELVSIEQENDKVETH